MSLRNIQQVSLDEVRQSLTPYTDQYGPLLSPRQFAKMLGISPSTLSLWTADGVFNGATTKRGKHRFYLRDKAVSMLFSKGQAA